MAISLRRALDSDSIAPVCHEILSAFGIAGSAMAFLTASLCIDRRFGPELQVWFLEVLSVGTNRMPTLPAEAYQEFPYSDRQGTEQSDLIPA